MHATRRQIIVTYGRRADGQTFIFRYDRERVRELYEMFEQLAARDDTSFDFDDCWLFTQAVRERLEGVTT